MIWYDVTGYDRIRYISIGHDMIWYDVTGYGVPVYHMIWYDVTGYDRIR